MYKLRNHYLIFVFIVIICQCFPSHSQDTANTKYFYELENNLKKDSNVQNIKIVQNFYWNGNVKNQALYARYKNDSLKRLWRLGKSFIYYKNGKQYCIVNVDIMSKALADTTFYYNESSKIVAMRIKVQSLYHLNLYLVFCQYFINIMLFTQVNILIYYLTMIERYMKNLSYIPMKKVLY
jgi:hypothetical protein